MTLAKCTWCAVIFACLVVSVVIIGYDYFMPQSVLAPTPEQMTAPSSPLVAGPRHGELVLGKTAIQFDYPGAWQRLIDAPYGVHSGVSDERVAKMWEVYPAGTAPQTSTQTDPGAANISLETYPVAMTNDRAPSPEEPYWGLHTSQQKSEILAPLVSIYQNTNLSGTDLQYRSTSDLVRSNHIGAWWGSENVIQYRIDPRYIESADGDLRGVAFFANETQEESLFRLLYEVVLINPEKRTVVELTFDIDNLAVIKECRAQFDKDYEEDANVKGIDWRPRGMQNVQSCYSRLSDPKNPELNAFKAQIADVVGSIKMVDLHN